MKDSKYMTFKRDELEKWMANNPSPGLPSPVPDAVVIRRQDAFAPPALDAYANAIMCVIEVLSPMSAEDEALYDKLGDLQDISDYFHAQASVSWDAERKLPD